MPPFRRQWSLFVNLALAGLMVLLLARCEEDVTAVLGANMPFSLYGVLTPEAETQFIRVFPIEGTLKPARPEPLDAHFTSTDLQDGTQFVWADSIIQDANEQVAHVFWAPFQAAYGHTYRIEVTRSDGAASSATVEVPVLADLMVREPRLPAVVQDVFVNGEVPRLMQIEVIYLLTYQQVGGQTQEEGRIIPYDGKQLKTTGGWLIPIQLALDFLAIRAALRREGILDSASGIQLRGIDLKLLAVNEAWAPPNGIFDPDVLVEPGTLTNVENGFGFVGAGYTLRLRWLPPDHIIRAAGFAVP